MNETGRSILEMLRDGQITLEAAERLLDALMEKVVAQAVTDALAARDGMDRTASIEAAAPSLPVNQEAAPVNDGTAQPETNAGDPPFAQTLPPVSGNAFVPWPDDNTLRIAAFLGQRIIKAQDGSATFSVKLDGDAKDVVCYGNLECDNITGNVTADGNLACDSITASTINIGGNLEADAIAASTVMAGGDIECDDVGGNVNAGGNVECGDIGGSVMAGGNLECGDVGGSASAGGNLECGDVGGDASAGGNLECGDVNGNTCDGTSGGGARTGDAFKDFMNNPDWKAARENWEKQAQEFRRQWDTQGREVMENMRRAAHDMGNVASHLARDIGRSVNETLKKFK